jgi:hypothetical protein
MAVSMFETAELCWALIDRTKGIGDHVAELRLVPGRGVCAATTGGPLHWSVWGDPAVLHAAVTGYVRRLQVEPAHILKQTMTYSIFDSTGNLVDAFGDRDAAVAALTSIVRAEPESADEVFVVTPDDEGHVGETIYGSSLHTLHSCVPRASAPEWTLHPCSTEAQPRGEPAAGPPSGYVLVDRAGQSTGSRVRLEGITAWPVAPTCEGRGCREGFRTRQ